MQKPIKNNPKLLTFNKSIFLFLGILYLFQVFTWLIRASERYSEEYFMGSSFQDWPPSLVTSAFCFGLLTSWITLTKAKTIKYKSELFMLVVILIIPFVIFGFYSAMVWNDFMLRDLGGMCLIGYMSGFFIRSSFLDIDTAQNLQMLFRKA